MVVHGDRLDNLSFSVEGSPELLALVKQRFAAEELENMTFASTVGSTSPRAFLSYAREDRQLAEQVAAALQANGIDTWWAGWCIGAGDSLRQKIDEGLADCTHFLVLLTPASITKPWVNQEMDAGLVRKLNENTRFIAVRSGLAASALPPLLAGMLSPSKTFGRSKPMFARGWKQTTHGQQADFFHQKQGELMPWPASPKRLWRSS